MHPPHGNTLVDRRLDPSRSEELLEEFDSYPQVLLDHNELMDFVNVSTGVYSPLTGFMGQNDFLKVVNDMALETGVPWTLPIVLDVSSDVANSVGPGDRLGLVSPDGDPVGVLDVDDIYRYNATETCEKVFGTTDPEHPGVSMFRRKEPFFVGGDVKQFAPSPGSDRKHRLTPRETRVLFKQEGWDTIVGFQTRNVPHRAHEYLQKSALEHVDGLLIQPKIGEKKTGDYENEAILSAYETLVSDYYPNDSVLLSTFRSRMWYAGPREAVFDGIVRKNYGCTQFIVGRDHAGVGDYYGDFEAQELYGSIGEIGVEPVFYHYAFYCDICDGVVSEKICPHDADDRVEPSGTKLRSLLQSGKRPSPKLMRPEVADEILKMKDVFVEA